MAAGSGRVAILREISDWLKLLGLIVLAGEALLAVAYHYTKPDDSIRPYFFPLMIGLFSLVVVGLFFDRWINRQRPVSSREGPRQTVYLTTRWYFRSGITEEELHLEVLGKVVSGTRRTTHPKGTVTEYGVSGWRHGATYWLEYHLLNGNGGGAILLDEFTNDKFSGMVLSKDCDTGVKQCRANVWFPIQNRKNHKETDFMFVGAITPLPEGGFVAQSTPNFAGMSDGRSKSGSETLRLKALRLFTSEILRLIETREAEIRQGRSVEVGDIPRAFDEIIKKQRQGLASPKGKKQA